MLSRIIMFPFVIIAGYNLYQMVFDYRDHYPVIFIVCILIIAAIIMIEPQINLWWVKKKPPKTDPGLKNFLYNYIPFYRGLPHKLRGEFEIELALNEYRFEIFSKTDKDLSDDLKTLCCIYPTILDYNHQMGLSKKFSRAAIYAHPFLSPLNMEEVHISELHTEDGLFVYTFEHLQLGFRSPEFFNIALYEPAKAFLFMSEFREKLSPLCPDLEEILEAGPYDKTKLKAYCGVLPDDPEALLIHHFFTFPEKIKELAPDAFELLLEIFGDHHILSRNTVLF